MKYKFLVSTLFLPIVLLVTNYCEANFSYDKFIDLTNVNSSNKELMNISYDKTNIINNEPIIITKLKPDLSVIEFDAKKLDYNNNCYNYIVFYEMKNGENIELFRQRLDSSGKAKITDSKVLSLIKNDMIIFARVECFNVENNKFKNYRVSKKSKIHFTPKSYTLEIKEDSTVVFNSKIISDQDVNKDGTIKLPLNYLRKYVVDKYYTYENSEVFIDEKLVDNNKELTLPYYANKITVNLSNVKSEWKNIDIVYPTVFQKYNNHYSEKLGTEFQKFLDKNIKDFTRIENNNYKFLGYYISNQNVSNYKEKISADLKIEARYDTKITVKNDISSYNYYFPTGTNLGEVDFKLFEKDGYLIEKYKLINNETGEEQLVNTLDKQYVFDSLIIEPQYKVKTDKIEVRQDEYNSRFGQVTNNVNKRDVEWQEIKPIGTLLEELRKDITPNEGYELQFRINKKVVTPETFVTKDSLLEIYFKRIEDDWITVKFIGDGIDRFLSDGQELLVGNKLDNINLPTSTGVSDKLIGWEVNNEYFVEKDTKKTFNRTKDTLVSNSDLPFITAQRGKNLIFTAVYEKKYNISFYNEINGKIYAEGENKGFSVLKGKTIKEGLFGKDIIILPNAHYKFLYFTSTLPVTLIKNGEKFVVPTGGKIYLEDFNNIIVDKNLTFIPKFVFQNGIEDNILENNNHNFIYDTIQRNYSKNLNDALGPLRFLL